MVEATLDRIRTTKCKYCGSPVIVRWGVNKDTDTQRLICRNCKRTFSDTDSLPGMNKSVYQIISTITMYYQGMSLNEIRKNFLRMYKDYSKSGIYERIQKFNRKAMQESRNDVPEVGDVWIVNDTRLNTLNKSIWVWDIIDTKTHFLLASHVSTSPSIKDVMVILDRAASKAEKIPKVVITNGLAAYISGVEFSYGADTKHIRLKNLRTSCGTMFKDIFYSSFGSRQRIISRIKSMDGILYTLKGWFAFYNYLQPNRRLAGITPAQKAGIEYETSSKWFEFLGAESFCTRDITSMSGYKTLFKSEN